MTNRTDLSHCPLARESLITRDGCMSHLRLFVA